MRSTAKALPPGHFPPFSFDKGSHAMAFCQNLSVKQALLVLFFAVAAYAGDKPAVSKCFQIHSMTRTDGEHYWADWTNACPYTIDSVYVMIGFWDKFHQRLGNGVWGLHFITQGAHRVTRFSAPNGVGGFQFLDIRKITTDFTEAFQ
jgi:hypothetical protein